MKNLVIPLVFVFLFSCNSSPIFEKEYYEKVSGIKFPNEYTTLATLDNGEFLTITLLELKKADCNQFIRENKFEPLSDNYLQYYQEGLSHLDTSFQKIPDPRTCMVRDLDKVKGKVGWTYIIDTTNCRLFCEIDYPDWGGN